MLRVIGVVLNLGVVFYLGYQWAVCQGLDQIDSFPAEQHPLIFSFVAVVALFVALKN
ncbi:MAG: hypothetical protein KBA28_08800 [Syntrophaceae bacterium]|nr:hypothetical protein [Syntrophaceae bacterium]